MEEPKKLAWGFPILAKKAHVFSGNQSLCCKWWYQGANEPINEAPTKLGPDDCKACYLKVISHFQALEGLRAKKILGDEF